LLGLDLKKLENLAQSLAAGTATDPFVLLSTVIIFELLDTRFRAQSGTWKSITAKSSSWLKTVLQKGQPLIEGRELTSWAKDFVGKEIKMEMHDH
jgi:hypothetical protein